MNADAVRELFNTTLPRFLEATGAGHGFRCRFRVDGAGAWEVDLGLLQPRSIDGNAAPGAYPAVVHLGVVDWGADTPRNLMRNGRVRVALTDHASPNPSVPT
jgi:hypothetical protein